MSLVEKIQSWGRVAPDRVAHVSGHRALTYGELRRDANIIAAYLARELPDDGSPVAVVGHKEPEMLIAFLGAALARHPYVPIDDAQPPQRVERIVERAGARITLTPELVRAHTSDVMETVDAPERIFQADDPYYIMFTSGSTGEPKGVVITLGNLTRFVEWMLTEQKFGEGAETFLNQVPYSFDVSFMDTYLGLVTGGTVFSITRDDIANPKQLYQVLASSNVTTWVSTPSFAQLCLVERTFDEKMLPRVRRFLFCGETLATEIARQLLERFPNAEVWNTYGPTETTVATTSVRVTHELLAEYSPLPIGYPMPGTKIPVVDEKLKSVAEGERGEIVIAGANVSPGYLGRPDLTARAFFEFEGMRAYRTGDWGRCRSGLLFFEGRMDNQIKLHGYRIELGDVEANLRALPNVRDAVVIPLMKAERADSLAAFVIFNTRPAESDWAVSLKLRQQLGERLPAYMVPRKFCFVESFPMTVNGKADRSKLAERLI